MMNMQTIHSHQEGYSISPIKDGPFGDGKLFFCMTFGTQISHDGQQKMSKIINFSPRFSQNRCFLRLLSNQNQNKVLFSDSERKGSPLT